MKITIDAEVFYFLFVSMLRNNKILYLDIYKLLMVNYLAFNEKR